VICLRIFQLVCCIPPQLHALHSKVTSTYAELSCVVLLIMTAWSDYRTHLIPNAFTGSGILIGLGLSLLPQGLGLGNALAGLCVGLLIWMPFYLLRLLGAGDLKLLAAVGALVGFPNVLLIALTSTLVGGVLAVGLAASHGRLSPLWIDLHNSLGRVSRSLQQGRRPESIGHHTLRLPYAVAVALGTFLVLLWQHGLV